MCDEQAKPVPFVLISTNQWYTYRSVCMLSVDMQPKDTCIEHNTNVAYS